MNRLLIGGLTILISASVALPAFSGGDPKSGKAAYNTCMACHGAKAEGNKATNAPQLAGQYDWYLERQLKNFKAGIRGSAKGDTFGAQMKPMAMTLANDKAISDVVAYIGTMKASPQKETVKGDANAGKAAYNTCVACHGAKAEGNKALNAPNLKVLPDWYIVNQLKVLKAGHRGSAKGDTFGAQMKPMAMTLANDKAINDIASYIKSIR